MLERGGFLKLNKRNKSNIYIFVSVIILTTIILIIFANLFSYSITAYYSEVYQYSEGEWQLIDITGIDPEDDDSISAYCTVHEPEEYHGNMMQEITLKNTVMILNNNNSNNPGELTISVKPLTDNIAIRPDGKFEVPLGEYAAWEFSYFIKNISDDGVMNKIVVFDSFGAELNIENYEDSYSVGVIPGVVDIRVLGSMEKYFFNWDSFSLGPGEWAKLIIEVGLGENPAGKQQYTSCTPCTEEGYALNSEGTLKYQKNEGPGYEERKGSTFWVKVPCESYLDIEVSATEIDWYLRKPGDFFAKPLTANVRSTETVVVTFSEFSDLKALDNEQTIPVFYAFNDHPPIIDDWIPAPDLKDETQFIDASEDGIEWSMWQRILLDVQRACQYQNRGVITFTINNQ